jgi:hypothetical protein
VLRRVLALAALGGMVILTWASSAAAQTIDMRERVSAARSLPLLLVKLGDTSPPLSGSDMKSAVISRVYDGPRTGARELGVLLGRRVLLPNNEWGVDVTCRMHGEAERKRWLTLMVADESYGALALALGFRGTFAHLPPAACGLPVWWPMQTTDLSGSSGHVAPFELYTLPAAPGEIAYTGKPVVINPERVYRLLRVHDGVIELRQEWVLDTAHEGDLHPTTPDEREWLAWAHRQPIPPTIRINIADIVDAEGRVQLTVAYPYGC